MKPRRSALTVLLLAAAGPASAQQPSGTAADARVDAVFARFAGPASPGCAVGVSRDGKPVLARAYGLADLEHDVPNTPTTVFEAGSVSKQFTAAAVVLLAEQGKLSLDDDVRKYIPELPDYGEPITIRHLLTHTSGLRDWGEVAAIGGWPRGSRVHTHAHVLDIVRRQKALNYRPGEYYSYTNTGYNLQAILVERVSGMPFAEFSRKHLFEPLGLTSTQWRDDFTRVVRGRAVAYRPAGNGEFRLDMPFENVHGNGGLLTTVGDLLRWTEALQTGKGLSPTMLREMHRQMRLNAGRQIEYAGGLMVTRHAGVPEVSHSGSTGGYRAYLARFPEQRVAVALLCNAAHASPGGLAHQVAEVFLGEDAYTAAETRTAAVSAEDLAQRAGVYRDTRRGQALRLVMAGGDLRVASGPVLVPVSASSFRAGPRARLEFGSAPGNGGRAGFLWIGSDGDTLRYDPVPEFAPASTQLHEFTGTYHSDEAEATYTVSVEDGKLVMRDRFGGVRPLTPVYADAFEGPGGLFRFVRDPAGRVVEMSAVLDRVWDMRFTRQ